MLSFEEPVTIELGITDEILEVLNRLCLIEGKEGKFVLTEIKLTANADYKFEAIDKITGLEDLGTKGIGLFDYFLYRQLASSGSLPENLTQFSESEERKGKTFEVQEYKEALFYLYFLIMTRNTTECGNQAEPGLIKNFLGIKMEKSRYKLIISSNNFSGLPKKWVRDIDISKFSEPIRNRIKLGICGTRQFNVFASYPITSIKKTVATATKFTLHSQIKTMVERGPFWEYHPLFQPDNLKAISIAKNLENFMIEIYTFEELEMMIKDKALFRMPRTNSSKNYTGWDDAFFANFVTPIFPESSKVSENIVDKSKQ